MKKLIAFLLVLCLALTMLIGMVSWFSGSDALAEWFSWVVHTMGSLLLPFVIIFGGFYILIRGLFR